MLGTDTARLSHAVSRLEKHPVYSAVPLSTQTPLVGLTTALNLDEAKAMTSDK